MLATLGREESMREVHLRIQLVTAITLMLAANGGSLAQTPEGPRYPWDQRPNKCFMPGAEPIGMCAPVDSGSSAQKVSQHIFVLFANETYGLLERYLSDLLASNKRFADGGYPEEAMVDTFGRLMPGVIDDGRGVRAIAAWRKVAPESQFLLLAEAHLAWATAWNARGSGYANTVSREAWELFAIRLQEAEQILLKAPPSLKDSPAWHLTLLGVALDANNRVATNPEAVFDAAVKRWPTYARFYQLRVGRMVPKWGGSWAQVEAFIRAASRLQPASEGKSLYARLYASLGGKAPYESSADWEMLKASFEDAIARFPDPKYKNLYASYACLAKDKAAFGEAMGKMASAEFQPGWWLNGHSADSCVRWASA